MFGLFKKKTAPAGDQKAKKKRGQRGRRGNAKRFANGDGASVLPLKTSGKTITHMNLDVNDARVYFGALGGMEEIGCNLYLYGTGGDWIIVDLGIGFADERLPGAQRRIPDVSFLKSIKGRIRGILLTHSHYDHFAAIADVWEEIRCPVWGTPFALEMLAHMLAEKGLGRKVEMNRVDPAGESFKLGAFEVEYIHATHSIPESSFIVLRTPQGLIFHSGDFRFDPEPVIGATTDMERLAELGREGVLACMCESTNSLIHESGRTEKTAAEELFKTMSSIKSGKIVVTCFATSIARVSSVWEAAKKLGRKLAVAGRSFHINIAAAKKCGYLSDLDYIEINDAVKMADDEVIYLCTGTQGEPRSTITRLASETYANLHIGAGDTVIFSSRVIPGNEKAIFSIQNSFARRGANVISVMNNFMIHSSGHATREELSLLLSTLKPKIVIPIHAEPIMAQGLAQIAWECGLKDLILRDGEFIAFEGDAMPRVVESIQTGEVVLDGKRRLARDSDEFHTRSLANENGALFISAALSKKGLAGKASISSIGLLESDASGVLKHQISKEVENVVAGLSKIEITKDSLVKDRISSAIARAVKKAVDKRPIIEIHITRV